MSRSYTYEELDSLPYEPDEETVAKDLMADVRSAKYEGFSSGEDREWNRVTLTLIDSETGIAESIDTDVMSEREEYHALVETAFERGPERYRIVRTSEITVTKTLFSGELYAKSAEKRKYSRLATLKAEQEKQEAFDEYAEAVEWARQNGANLRRQKQYNKQNVIVKVHEAGLDEEWNRRYPRYAFDEEKVSEAVSFLKEREAFYARKKRTSARKVRA